MGIDFRHLHKSRHVGFGVEIVQKLHKIGVVGEGFAHRVVVYQIHQAAWRVAKHHIIFHNGIIRFVEFVEQFAEKQLEEPSVFEIFYGEVFIFGVVKFYHAEGFASHFFGDFVHACLCLFDVGGMYQCDGVVLARIGRRLQFHKRNFAAYPSEEIVLEIQFQIFLHLFDGFFIVLSLGGVVGFEHRLQFVEKRLLTAETHRNIEGGFVRNHLIGFPFAGRHICQGFEIRRQTVVHARVAIPLQFLVVEGDIEGRKAQIGADRLGDGRGFIHKTLQIIVELAEIHIKIEEFVAFYFGGHETHLRIFGPIFAVFLMDRFLDEQGRIAADHDIINKTNREHLGGVAFAKLKDFGVFESAGGHRIVEIAHHIFDIIFEERDFRSFFQINGKHKIVVRVGGHVGGNHELAVGKQHVERRVAFD